MTQLEKQLKIADYCGWTQAFHTSGGILLPYRWENTDTKERVYDLPDYFNDLNAMHDAERHLQTHHAAPLWDYYLDNLLCGVIDNPDSPPDDIDYDTRGRMISATAAQRANAFLTIIP